MLTLFYYCRRELTIHLLAVAAVPAEAVCCCCVRVYVGVHVTEVC